MYYTKFKIMNQPKTIIPEERLHNFKPRQLNPPVFEDATKEHYVKHIAFSQTVQQVVYKGVKL